MGNVVRDGVVMLFFLSIIFIAWLVLSGPFEDITSNFEDLNMTASDTKVEETGGYLRGVWNIVFAGLAVVPVIWFVVRMFQRESEWRY